MKFATLNVSVLLAGVLTVLSVSLSAQADIVDLQSRSDFALQAQKAGFSVKDSWVNHLTEDQVHRVLGLANTPNDEATFSAPEDGSAYRTSVDSVDWRNKDGVNWDSPILNQGNCGSCVAFASVGTLQAQVNISSAIPGLNPRYSAQAIFSCGGGACDEGWMPESAASYLQSTGAPDESCAPYTSGASGQDVSCSAICGDSAQRSQKISQYSSPTRGSRNIASVKEALHHGPLVTTLTVYSDFLVYSTGVYKHTTGKALGGHAVSIVGYDDSKNAFIIRNSWGPEWGDNGYAYVSYDDRSGIGQETWSFEVAPASGYVSLVAPRIYSAIAQTAELKAMTNYPGATGIAFYILPRGSGLVAASTQCTGAVCSVTVDTTKLADGIYNVTTVALNGTTELGRSAPETISVVNGTPQMSISFSAHAISLDKPLTDRIVFDIQAPSLPVPMTKIVFHYKDSSGVEKTKVSLSVLPVMTLGWRTNTVPNGQYDIWFTGHIITNAGEKVVESTHSTVTTKN